MPVGIGAIKLGTKNIIKVYKGSTLVFDVSVSAPSISAIAVEAVDLFEVTSHSFSYNHPGGKLLVLASGTIRDAGVTGVPTAGSSWAYNSVAPNTGPTIITPNSNSSPPPVNGMGIVQYALWDSPASGANTLAVDWSTDGVRDLVVQCIALSGAGAINSVTGGQHGTFQDNGDHSHTVTEANTLVISGVCGRDSASRDTLSSTTHTVAQNAVSVAATGDAAILHTGYVSNPSVGSLTCDLDVGASDYIGGFSIEIGAA